LKKSEQHLLVYAAMAVLVATMLFNTVIISQVSGDFTEKIGQIKQVAAPPKVELTLIESSCEDCSTVSSTVAGLKGLGMDITEEKTLDPSSSEAKELIEKHGIGRLPAIIVGGETFKLDFPKFRQSGNALVYDTVQPPYQDPVSGEVIGKVSAIILKDDGCSICWDMGTPLESIKQSQILVSEERTVEYMTEEGQSLIRLHSIGKIPAMLLSENINDYPGFSETVTQLNLESKNGFYVLESPLPHIDTNSGTLLGEVSAIYLDDKNCDDCYDVNIHKQVLARFGIPPAEEKTVDAGSSEGKNLIQKYNIDKIPTIILQGDVPAYSQFETLWLEQVGTKEEDGSYVFRELSILGENIKFKELE
jgi:hypothetical protein